MHSYMCDNPYKYYTTSLTGFNITSKIMGIILLMSDVRCKVGDFPSNHLEMKDRDTTANILSQATIHSHTYDNKHKDCRTTLMEMISKSRCVWEEWETTVSLLSTLTVVGGSPTTPAPATTAPALVNILMPSGIPMGSNAVLSNNDGDGNNEGENTTTVSLSPTDIPSANKMLDSNSTTSGETMGFFYCTTTFVEYCGVGFCCGESYDV